MHLDADQARRNDGDAIWSSVCLFASGEDHRIDQRVTETPGEPVHMAYVIVADVASQLALNREDAAVFPLDDQIDLMLPSTRSQMKDPGLRCLGIHAQ